MPESILQKTKEKISGEWDAAAEAWQRWGPVTAHWMIPLTEVMLDMSGVSKGHRVLDIAAGTGQQGRMAAKRVAAEGQVLCTDLSDKMLQFATENAKKAGFGHLETRRMDAEKLDVTEGAFDAAICRMGLMYFPEPKLALSGMYRALKRGGRAAIATLSVKQNNALFAVPWEALERHHFGLPEGAGNLFRFSDEKRLENELAAAGFRGVEICTVASPLKMPSTGDCVRFLREAFGAFHATVSDSLPDSVWQEMERDLGRYGSPRGFTGPCEAIVAVGLK